VAPQALYTATLAWNAHRHLQILRLGQLFFLRTSQDGQHWVEMPGSPVPIPRMASGPLHAGLYHASCGAERSYITFQRFQLTTRR
jgi:hypothetical protein